MGLEGEVSVDETVAKHAGQFRPGYLAVLAQRAGELSGSRRDRLNCDRTEARCIDFPCRSVVEALAGLHLGAGVALDHGSWLADDLTSRALALDQATLEADRDRAGAPL